MPKPWLLHFLTASQSVRPIDFTPCFARRCYLGSPCLGANMAGPFRQARLGTRPQRSCRQKPPLDRIQECACENARTHLPRLRQERRCRVDQQRSWDETLGELSCRYRCCRGHLLPPSRQSAPHTSGTRRRDDAACAHTIGIVAPIKHASCSHPRTAESKHPEQERKPSRLFPQHHCASLGTTKATHEPNLGVGDLTLARVTAQLRHCLANDIEAVQVALIEHAAACIHR